MNDNNLNENNDYLKRLIWDGEKFFTGSQIEKGKNLRNKRNRKIRIPDWDVIPQIDSRARKQKGICK